MNARIVIAAAALASALAASHPAQAQNAEPITLPPICTADAGHDMGSMGEGHQMTMDEAHADLMRGMDEMNAQMMKGMTASDIDVAFICGMIPHHQGAINMARAELAHGDDQWARDMARKVIDAQEKEIAEMLGWLEDQAE